MTIYPDRPPSFTCAICNEFFDWSDQGGTRWRYAAEYDIPPLCRHCEKTWGKSIGGWGDLNRDRRIARQIAAMAHALETEAWRAKHRKESRHAKR